MSCVLGQLRILTESIEIIGPNNELITIDEGDFIIVLDINEQEHDWFFVVTKFGLCELHVRAHDKYTITRF